MKREYLKLCILSACCICHISCTDAELEQNPILPETDGIELQFEASLPALDTKISVSGLDLAWKPYDAISVFADSDSENNLFFTEKGGNPAIFEGKVTSTANRYFAVYPKSSDLNCTAGKLVGLSLPESQVAEPGNFAKKTNICIASATSEAKKLEFSNLFAFLKFKLSGTVANTINHIVLEDHSENACVAGEIVIPDMSTSAYQFSEKLSRIVLQKPVEGFSDGTEYYITVAPESLAGGFSLEFFGAGEESMQKLEFNALESSLAAGDVHDLGNIDISAIPSVELKSRQEVLDFKNPNKDGFVNNLYITGNDIYGEHINSLIGQIKEVKGNFSLVSGGISVCFRPEDGGFFGAVKFDGDFMIKDDNMNNINNFKMLQNQIYGNFILENCPGLDFGWNNNRPDGAGFQRVKSIAGDCIIRNVPLFVSEGFRDLASIGGDFIVEKAKGQPWNKFTSFVKMLEIKTIGGNLIIKGNPNLKSLDGLEKLESIGGNEITISADLSTDPSQKGFCLVKTWIEKGVIKNSSAKITLTDLSGNPIDLSTLEPCK